MKRLRAALKAFMQAWRQPEEQPLLENTPPTKAEIGHLRLLTMLQRSGRFVDFLKEDLTSFSDAQVGAAAREVHTECAKVLEDLVTIRPLYEESEGARVKLPVGYDATAVKLTGKVHGQPPYEGILVHRGWKAAKRSLPKQALPQTDVVCPAEIEVR